LKEAKATLERHMESLYRKALAVVDDYYKFKIELNKEMDWPKKSSLKPRVRQRGLSITAEWYDKRWYGSKAKGNRKAFTTYIAKPRTAHGYTLNKLLDYAQDWEKPESVVIKAETSSVICLASNIRLSVRIFCLPRVFPGPAHGLWALKVGAGRTA
jgi:hypothetical protein